MKLDGAAVGALERAGLVAEAGGYADEVLADGPMVYWRGPATWTVPAGRAGSGKTWAAGKLRDVLRGAAEPRSPWWDELVVRHGEEALKRAGLPGSRVAASRGTHDLGMHWDRPLAEHRECSDCLVSATGTCPAHFAKALARAERDAAPSRTSGRTGPPEDPFRAVDLDARLGTGGRIEVGGGLPLGARPSVEDGVLRRGEMLEQMGFDPEKVEQRRSRAVRDSLRAAEKRRGKRERAEIFR